MKFGDRVKISAEYREWLTAENEKNNFNIPFNPESFLAFLEIKGYLTEEKQTNTAEWITYPYNEVKCSNCDYDLWGNLISAKDEFKYCPNCGAKMTEK